MSLPLCLLALLAIFSGYLGSELFLAWGGFPLGAPGASSLVIEAGGVSAWMKSVPLLSSLLGVGAFFLGDYFFFEGWYLRCWRALGPYFYFAQYYNVFFNRIFVSL